MLAKFLRRWIGSVRLSVFLLTLLAGLAVVAADMICQLRNSQRLYGCIIALAGLAAVFMWKDTDRPAGYNPQGFRYDSEEEGKP